MVEHSFLAGVDGLDGGNAAMGNDKVGGGDVVRGGDAASGNDEVGGGDAVGNDNAVADDVREVLAKCKAKMGFVPNVFLAYAHDAEKFRAFRAMSNDLMKGDSPLSMLEREMIAVVVSSQNRCHYCLAAHGAAVRQLSGDAALGDALVHNYRAIKLSPRHRAMLDFAAALNDPEHLNAADERDKLMRAGFCHRAIFHIAIVAAFYQMTNRIAAAIDLQPNDEYFNIGRGNDDNKQTTTNHNK